MAILTRGLIIAGSIFTVGGCGSIPEVQPPEAVRHGIGWLNRQFETCAGTNCPQPTRKTLALVELPRKPQAIPLPAPVEPASSSKEIASEEIVAQTIRFAFGQHLPADSELKSLRDLMPQARKAIRIEVLGRTDDIGSKPYNDRLARQRAEGVRDWLIRHEIHAPIKVRAEGRCCYLDPATTETARRSNRRVEVRLVHLVSRRDAVSNSKGVQ